MLNVDRFKISNLEAFVVLNVDRIKTITACLGVFITVIVLCVCMSNYKVKTEECIVVDKEVETTANSLPKSNEVVDKYSLVVKVSDKKFKVAVTSDMYDSVNAGDNVTCNVKYVKGEATAAAVSL